MIIHEIKKKTNAAFTLTCKDLGIEVTESFYSETFEKCIRKAMGEKAWINEFPDIFIEDMVKAWNEGKLEAPGNNTGEDLCRFIYNTFFISSSRNGNKPLSLSRIRTIFYSLKG